MFDHARQSHLARAARRNKKGPPIQSSSLVRWQHQERTKSPRHKNHTQPRTKRPGLPAFKRSHQATANDETLSLFSHPTSLLTKRILLGVAICCFSLVVLEVGLIQPASIADVGLPQLYLPLLLPIFVGLFCLARLKATSALAILPAAGVTMLVSLRLQHFAITWQVLLAICCILGVGAIVGILLRKLVLL